MRHTPTPLSGSPTPVLDSSSTSVPSFTDGAAPSASTPAMPLVSKVGGLKIREQDEEAEAQAAETDRFSELSPSHLRRELFLAIKKNNVDDVRELLKRGVYVNSLNADRNTPFRVAVAAGSADVVELLLAQPGLEVNDIERPSYSALIDATTWGHYDTIKLLLKHHSIDVNARDEDGLTALSIAAFYGYAKIVRLLLDDPRVELDIRAENGLTPLEAAMEGGNEEVIELLKGRVS